MKSLKWILAIPLVIVILIATMLIMIDPNDYRQDIVVKAKENAGLNLRIDGEIDWSFIPLGLSLNNIALLDQDEGTFSEFSNLTLEIDTLSLLKLQPHIHTVSLDGLDLTLSKDKSGKGNWENLLSDKKDAPVESAASEAPSSSEVSSSSQLNFLVQEIKLTNASLAYADAQTGQTFNANDVQLAVNDIALNQAFPISLSLALKSSALGDEILKGSINSKLMINTTDEKIEISDLQLLFEELAISARIALSNYTSQPDLSANINIASFALNPLLKKLGQPPVLTSNEKALSDISLNTRIDLRNNALNVSDLTVKVDQSTWQGQSSINLDTQAVTLALTGDKILLDDYLPPEQANASDAPAPDKPPASAADDQGLLPLETLRGLDLDISLIQKAVDIKQLKFTDMDLKLTAKDGLLKLEKANTGLFNGNIVTSASIDARTDNPAWSSNVDVSKLNLLEHIGSTTVFGWELGGAGEINLAAQLNALGNAMTALQEQAKGKIKLDIKDGALTGINLNKYACEGFASLNRKQITKTDWANETRFNSLTTSIKIDGKMINSPELIIENIGLKAIGQGKVDLNKQDLAYYLDITPSSELGDEACIVNEKVKGIAIPLKCEGSFDTAPSKLCGLNTKRLGRIAEKLLKNEAKRKAEKEVDSAIEKKLDKYIDKDSELGNALKKGLKGLFQ